MITPDEHERILGLLRREERDWRAASIRRRGKSDRQAAAIFAAELKALADKYAAEFGVYEEDKE